MEIRFTTQIFKKGREYVAYTPELDLSSCGDTEGRALANLKEAVRLFLEEADKIGTLTRGRCSDGFAAEESAYRGPANPELSSDLSFRQSFAEKVLNGFDV